MSRKISASAVLAHRKRKRQKRARAQLICAAIFLPINAALAWWAWPHVAYVLEGLAR